MAENSKIEWTDHTVNLWWGCAKVHTGCKNCYAEYLSDTRYKNDLWGENAPRKRIKSAFKDLNKYQRQARAEGRKIRVFVGSMMDIFEPSKPLINPIEGFETTGDIRREFFNQIDMGLFPDLVFLLLTKRPENINKHIPLDWPFTNVWFGTSISDNDTAYTALRHLIMETPMFSNLFLSIEPQTGPINLRSSQHIMGRIGWIIQGGESGHKKRPFNIEWAESMKDQCKLLGIPYFFKQIDKVQPIPDHLKIRELPNFFNSVTLK